VQGTGGGYFKSASVPLILPTNVSETPNV